MKAKIYYYRAAEEHFVETYGVEVGLKKYRNITFPLNEEVNTTAEEIRAEVDHVMIVELEIPEKIQDYDPMAIAEYAFMAMNNYNLNPLAVDYYEKLGVEDVRQGQRKIRENKCSHTSMSVGDAVEINGEIYLTASIGFVKL